MAQFEMLEGKKAKLTITISAEEFENAINGAYHNTVLHYNVPGFRRGKAPRKMIEALYGEGVFYEDAFEKVWRDAYDAAIAEHNLYPVDQPELDINKINKDGVEFVAIVQLPPDVTLGEYKGLKVPKSDLEVSDEDVDKALESEREKQARFTDVDREAQNGDRLLLDYSGSVDGVKFDGGTAEDQMLVLGSNAFIPGFEAQLVGIKAGEQKDITVTFPTEYHAKELAGKEAVFACNVKAVQVKELPEVDDDFIADISEFDTIAEWKADQKEKMIAEKKRAADIARENTALKIACDNATVDIPAVMIDRQVELMVNDFKYRLSQSGLDLKTYALYLGTTPEEIEKNFRPDAEEQVKLQLVLDAVVEAEHIEANDDEIQAEINRYCDNNDLSIDDFKSNLSEGQINYFKDRANVEKAVRLIADSAVEEA